MKVFLTPLLCPACGAEVPARSDELLVCLGCGALHEVREGETARLDLATRASVTGLDVAETLRPVWCFDVRVEVRAGSENAGAAALAARQVERVYVDAGERYPGEAECSREDPVAVESRPRKGVLAPCLRTSAEARAWLRPTLLSWMDRQVDITGLELDVRADRVRLVLLPGD